MSSSNVMAAVNIMLHVVVVTLFPLAYVTASRSFLVFLVVMRLLSSLGIDVLMAVGIDLTCRLIRQFSREKNINYIHC